ncbi:MAG: hypothetical protein KJ077_09115 [Anaerolineae bacterium]|nr:hypothetical protein [Anaerolineae bacterium]
MTHRKLLKQVDKEFYPDLVAAGGLPLALKNALDGFGQILPVNTVTDVNFIPYARAEEGSRFSQVYIAAGKRLFLFDFWSQGVVFAHGESNNLSDVAQAIYIWIKEKASIETMQNRFNFFVPTEAGKAHEAGTIVEHQWQGLLTRWKEEEKHIPKSYPSPRPLIEAAMQRPELRQLYPFTSLNRLCFSRTTGYPFTHDCPQAEPLGNGKFRGYSAQFNNEQKYYEIIGEGTAEEVIEMLVNHLPADCGPAINGTADDLIKT